MDGSGTEKKAGCWPLAGSVDSIELLHEREFDCSIVRQGSSPTNNAAKQSEQSADAQENKNISIIQLWVEYETAARPDLSAFRELERHFILRGSGRKAWGVKGEPDSLNRPLNFRKMFSSPTASLQQGSTLYSIRYHRHFRALNGFC